MIRTLLFSVSAIFTLVLHAQTRLSGTILAQDDRPLEGVSIIVGDEQRFGTTTDALGRFTMPGVRPGDVRLRASHVGYQPLDTMLQLVPGANEASLRMTLHVVLMREAEISGVRTSDRAPFAQSTMTREEIERMNTGVDLPILLDLQPSVVTTTDGGTGIGYTGIRIRGTDATRINVTLNGVPINDPESQAVFWVNMPDLATSLEDVQVQRGVGSSTNGPGAFGASINMRTTTIQKDPFGEVSVFGGSFNTQRYNARFGTGIINPGSKIGGFSFDGRLSSIRTDGYVDRATADLQSYFFQGAWMGAKRSLRFITMSGREVTYQAWAGVSPEILDTNRTYNPYTYENEVDNYRQTHYQLLFDQRVGDDATLNVTLFRVQGAGYFEQFRRNARFSDHDLPPLTLGDTTITRSDLIRRRWLDNVMHGGNITYDQRFGSHRLILGGSYNEYHGDHFGEVIWSRFSDVDIRHQYYFNDARKTDGNIFGKFMYAMSEDLDLFSDLQVRQVSYGMLGVNNDLRNIDQDSEWTFFNPKAGITWTPHEGGRLYGSVAVGSREPSRRDMVESDPQRQPLPEHLIDYEAGYEWRTGRFAAGVNLYYMDYIDQLILTGELSDVGYALRTNVPESYRTGVEFTWAARFTDRVIWRGNTTLSRNMIRNFTEFVDDWDTGEQRVIEHGDTEIAFSPSVIASSEIILRFLNRPSRAIGELALVTKYVGRQYLDNTASEDRALDAYLVNDIRVNLSLLRLQGMRSIDFNLTFRNVLSELYESNGWVYSFYEDGRRQEMIGLYPQAPFNFLGGVTFRF